jgi:hypothetical protein
VGYVGVLLELSRKLLARGQHHEAEDLVAGSLQAILEQFRDCGHGDAELAAECACHALELAIATGRTRWVDYVFELYHAIDQLMPDALIDESYRVLSRLPNPSTRLVETYVARMERHSGLGPSDRCRVERMRGLAEMMAAR